MKTSNTYHRKLATLTPWYLVNLFYLFTIFPFTVASQSRGTQPGEVYFSTTWYYSGTEQYDMIIRTTDHGLTFKPIYVYNHNSANMPIGQVYADAKEGVLYNYLGIGLYVSNDSATNWVEKTTPGLVGRITTGKIPGEIFKCCASNEGYIWKSKNSGDTFDTINENYKLKLEVGNDDSVIYAYSGYDYNTYLFFRSNNNGVLFDTVGINPDIAGYSLGNGSGILTRGANNGEVYIASWFPPASYKIFRSTDYGETFTLQYEQPDTCDFYYENYSFTAGRGSGEFYIFKGMPWFDGVNTKLQVYYSSDYANTFTRYEHVFEANWTGVNEQLTINKEQLKNYPNPFTDKTTISYSGNIHNKPTLEIYNVSGILMESLPIKEHSVEWNSGNKKPGIYFYRIKTDNYISKTQTIIKLD